MDKNTKLILANLELIASSQDYISGITDLDITTEPITLERSKTIKNWIINYVDKNGKFSDGRITTIVYSSLDFKLMYKMSWEEYKKMGKELPLEMTSSYSDILPGTLIIYSPFNNKVPLD